jgi:hypothetical protein
MEDRTMIDNNDVQRPDAQEKGRDGAGKNAGPTEEERAELIRDLQTQAMERKQDPLAASVELLCGDLMGFAFQVRKSMDEECRKITVNPASFKAFEKRAELLLRFARQIDRFAQIRRQLSSESEE